MNREEAIKWLKAIEKKYIHGGDEEYDNLRKIALHMAMESLEQPERKHGKWLPLVEADENGEPYQVGFYCSECYNGEVYEPHYCSCCGADMRKERNE